jgi:N-acylneuraminate cytidylyltransferase/CMP-N,N'-diacetyllegionaminic acid synthase
MDITMKRLCTIGARGGSKGVKNKNVRELLGKPLIAHTILQAKASELFDAIAVSSDSRLILDIAKAYGADILVDRPAEMATDEAPKMPAIQHCVRMAEQVSGISFDTIVDMDATSPLREVEDIRAAVRLLEERNVSTVITGAPAHRSPYFNLVELDENGVAHLSKTLAKPVVRRQDAPKCFDMNASMDVWKRSSLFSSTTVFNSDTLLYEMPPERSVDIDSELDFQIVEFLMAKREKERG